MTRIWIAWAMAAALSAAVHGHPAYAQDAAAPADAESPLKVGDRFNFRVGPVIDVHKVVAVDAKSVTLESKVFGTITMPRSISGAWSWTGGDFTLGLQESFDAEPPSLMPLVVGKKVQATGKARNPRGEYYFVKTCTVAARSSLDVPAGTFDVYRIQCDYRVLGGDPQTRIYYYAPQLGYWAAFQSSSLFRLTRYHKAP